MNRIKDFIDSYQLKKQGLKKLEFTIHVLHSTKELGLSYSHPIPTIELDDEDLDYFYNKYYEKYLEEYRDYLNFESERLNGKIKEIEQQFNQLKDGK